MHIYLIGYRGSGKSTVGKLLAQALQRPFVDSDDEIERTSGKSIREIFAEDGESGFRDLEQAVVMQLATNPPAVIALGGGAILRAANQRIVRDSGRCVWLRGSPEALYKRIEADQQTAQRRPRLSDRTGYDEVKVVLAKRQPIYEILSDFSVNTDGVSPDSLVSEIAAWVRSLD